MMPLGSKAPGFRLPDPSGRGFSLTAGEAYGSPKKDDKREHKGTLVMFICNHCPFVVHIINNLTGLCREFQESGLAVFAINSNDTWAYPEDCPERMQEFALQHNFTFPYLFDETQEVAKAYQAACTPDFFLFDGELCLVYRGRMDESRPGNSMATDGADLKRAVAALLKGASPLQEQLPSMGCNIKWRPGNEPAWFI